MGDHCYKVVAATREGQMRSAIVRDSGWEHHYRLDQITRARHGELFVFRRPEDVLVFLRENNPWVMFPVVLHCECGPLTPVVWVAKSIAPELYAPFWRGDLGAARAYLQLAPGGTFSTPWVCPIRISCDFFNTLPREMRDNLRRRNQ